MWLVLILNALFASTFIIGKDVVSVIPPILFIAIRMIVAGGLLVTFLKMTKHRFPHIRPQHYPWLAGIVFFHIYLSFVCEYIGLQYVSGAKTSLLFNLSPFFTALLCYFFFNERMSKKKWLGLVIGFLGFIPVLSSQSSGAESLMSTLGALSWGEFSVITAVFSSCIGWICMSKLTRDFDYSYMFINSFGMFLGGVLALPTSYLLEAWPSATYLMGNVIFWRSLILLILVGNVICFNLYGKLLHVYSATALSFFGFMIPFFASIMGWFWLGEEMNRWFFISLVVVSAGLYLFYQEELKHGITARNN